MNKTEKLAVSACLLGVACRYDGKSVPSQAVIDLKEKYELVPICPEIMGGLATPRSPSEIVKGRLVNKTGCDVTAEYERGASQALYICKLLGIKKAVLKEKSPSCGSNFIYDGTHSGRLIRGMGVTAELFCKNGISVFSEDCLDKL